MDPIDLQVEDNMLCYYVTGLQLSLIQLVERQSL